MAISNDRNPMYLNKFVSNGFYETKVSDLLLLFCRQYYSVKSKKVLNQLGEETYNLSLSNFYKFLLCCLFPLQPVLDNFNVFRKKQFNLANTPWDSNPVTNFLNYYYDNVNNSIFLSYSSLRNTEYISSVSYNEPLWVGSVASNKPAWISSSQYDFSQYYGLIVNIPSYLYNNETIKNKINADINTLKPAGIEYKLLSF